MWFYPLSILLVLLPWQWGVSFSRARFSFFHFQHQHYIIPIWGSLHTCTSVCVFVSLYARWLPVSSPTLSPCVACLSEYGSICIWSGVYYPLTAQLCFFKTLSVCVCVNVCVCLCVSRQGHLASITYRLETPRKDKNHPLNLIQAYILFISLLIEKCSHKTWPNWAHTPMSFADLSERLKKKD